MSATAAARREDPDEDGADASLPGAAGRWPHAMSRAASMRISDVLRDLQGEFPSLTHSKLRFLEDQGLIDPVRTAAGYRQYSAADVERIRFVLSEQRDRYLPLKVIKEHLAALDAGAAEHDLAPRALPAGVPGRTTVASVAADAAVDPAVVEELVSAGMLRRGPGGDLDVWAAEVVRAVAGLGEFGIEARHLRPLRASADRHVALVSQVVAPWRSQQSTAAQTHADEIASQVGELCSRLHTAWLRQGVADLTR